MKRIIITLLFFLTASPSFAQTATPTPLLNPTSGISITELMSHPDSGNEWIEIYNNNDQSVNLKGWYIDDSTDVKNKIIESDLTIGPKSFAVYEVPSFIYNDDGDFAVIENNQHVHVSETVAYSKDYGTTLSWSKQSNGSWCPATISRGTTNNLCYVPITPTIISSKTTPTNSDITITINFGSDITTKQYKIGSGSWTTYSAPFTVSENTTISAQGIDSFGTTSQTASLIVTNIDKTKPVITIGSYATTTTTSDITVNATTNEGTLNYSSKTFIYNGYFDFVATDVAGNTTTQRVTISNIDKSSLNPTPTPTPTVIPTPAPTIIPATFSITPTVTPPIISTQPDINTFTTQNNAGNQAPAPDVLGIQTSITDTVVSEETVTNGNSVGILFISIGGTLLLLPVFINLFVQWRKKRSLKSGQSSN